MPLVTYLQGLPKARLCRFCGAEIKRKGQETCYFVIWVGILSNRKIRKLGTFPSRETKALAKTTRTTRHRCCADACRGDARRQQAVPPGCFVSLRFREATAAPRILSLQEQKLWFCATETSRLTGKKVGASGWRFRWRIDRRNWPGSF